MRIFRCIQQAIKVDKGLFLSNFVRFVIRAFLMILFLEFILLSLSTRVVNNTIKWYRNTFIIVPTDSKIDYDILYLFDEFVFRRDAPYDYNESTELYKAYAFMYKTEMSVDQIQDFYKEKFNVKTENTLKLETDTNNVLKWVFKTPNKSRPTIIQIRISERSLMEEGSWVSIGVYDSGKYVLWSILIGLLSVVMHLAALFLAFILQARVFKKELSEEQKSQTLFQKNS